jgi:hypothetical protein
MITSTNAITNVPINPPLPPSNTASSVNYNLANTNANNNEVIGRFKLAAIPAAALNINKF